MDHNITLPLNDEIIKKLHKKDKVLLTGWVYTARDAAHKRLYNLIKQGQELPFSIKGETIYYVGPTPSKDGKTIGSAGPTSSKRMDIYTPALLDLGLKGMIGKGLRSREVVDAMIKNRCVYFAAIGGAGALLSKTIKKFEEVCYDDLGTESVKRFYVENFPCFVAIDCYGESIYER